MINVCLNPVDVVRMNLGSIVSLTPLVKSDIVIRERLPIRIEALALRPLYADHLRREIQHLPQFRLLLADLVFRALTLRDVDYRSNHFVVACFIPHAMGAIVKVLDRTIRHPQPMLIVEVIPVLCRTLERLFDKVDIVRMRSLQNQVRCWFRSGRVSVDPGRLLGPEYPLRTRFHPDEASATEFLRVCQIRLTPPKFDFASLVLFDVEVDADPAEQRSIVRPERFGTTEKPPISSGLIAYAKSDLAGLTCLQTRRPDLARLVAIVRMQQSNM